MSPVPASCRCNSGGDSGSCGVASHSSVVLCDPSSGDRVLVVTSIPCVDGAPGDPVVEYFDPDSGIPVIPSGELVVCGFEVSVDFPTEICDDLEAVRTTVCGVVNVDGTVCVDSCGIPLDVNVTNSITITDPIDVNVLNFPAIQTVDGTVCIDDCGGSITIDDGGLSLTVDGIVNIGTMPEVEIKNDTGNPIPISKDLSVNALTNPVWDRISDGTTALIIDPSGAAAGAALVRLAGNAQLVDLAAWTAGTHMTAVVGGKFEGANLAGAAAIAVNTRAWLVTFRNAAGFEIGTTTHPVFVSQTDIDLTTSVVSSVAASVSSVTISASSATRKDLSVFNDSALANMFVKLGSAASTTSFTVRLAPGSFYELPLSQAGSKYTGIVTAVWSVASGSARVTELSV